MSAYIQTGLQALGDPTRFAIFEMLGDSPRAVNELAAGLPVSRPAVSQHLKVLKAARLVRDRREGTRRIYELNPEGLAQLRDHFAKLWDQSLQAFQKFAEADYREEKKNEARKRNRSRVQTHDAPKRPR